MYVNIPILFIKICIHILFIYGKHIPAASVDTLGSSSWKPVSGANGHTPDISVPVRYVRETH